jgi:ParB-like chromosome segregation protein Spo0J
MKIVDVPHEAIEPNPDNPNEMDVRTLEALREDIERRGFVQPVLVRPLTQVAGDTEMHVAECPMTKPKPSDRYTCICQHYEDERLTPVGGIEYRIIDGEHRWRVLGELGAELVPCVVSDDNETDANIRMVTMNRLRGQFVPIKLAHLLSDLATRIEPEVLQGRLAMDAAEIKAMLELGDYEVPPVEAQDDDRDPPEPKVGREVMIVATAEQASRIRELLGTDDPAEQAERIEERWSR